MHLVYFTEQPNSTYPEEEARKLGVSSLTFSNEHFDPVEGARLYNERLEEYIYAEEMGVDGVMLNEHHNAAFCMSARINMFAAALAAATKRVKIVLLGNVLPISDNPVQLAEEIGMIDMMSNGRLVSGFVRGGGSEQLANNANPAFNRERFKEAHDLIIKIWSEPGPFRWEGNHFQFRVVNPWALPLQKPHPRIWVPGLFSFESVVWAAQHRYPYICLNTSIDLTKQIWELYAKIAAEVGYEAGPPERGYLLRCHVADNEEKALRNGRQFMWMAGEVSALGRPPWITPPGYTSPTARRRTLEGFQRFSDSFEEQHAAGLLLAGTPDQVIARLKTIMEETRPSILVLWGNEGRVNHEDSMDCIRLLGQEVMPALREYGKELGLQDPFEAETPVSLAHMQSQQAGEPTPVKA